MFSQLFLHNSCKCGALETSNVVDGATSCFHHLALALEDEAIEEHAAIALHLRGQVHTEVVLWFELWLPIGRHKVLQMLRDSSSQSLRRPSALLDGLQLVSNGAQGKNDFASTCNLLMGTITVAMK